MSEITKTAVYFAVALVVVGLAVFTQPRSNQFDVETMVGEPLLAEEFAIDAPRRLAIDSVDPETGERREFEVAEKDGLWTIPSKAGYPADATERMVAAVEGMAGRKILAIATDEASRHAEFGVLDPSASASAIDAEAVGTRVKLTGADDKTLADLIVGKEVTETDGKQRYVRLASQDAVYVTEIDLGSFTTDFGDWIEKDLLGLSTLDVEQLTIDDYSARPQYVVVPLQDGSGIRMPVADKTPRSKFQLSFDEEQSQWMPDSLSTFNPTLGERGEYVPFSLDADQELNSDALRELKNALDDLQIVDVERKPDGLSADLKAGTEFMKSIDTIESLARRGFLIDLQPNSPPILASSDGELIVTLKNGVEYVLRFGDLQRGGDAAAAATAPEGDEATSSDASVNRYLFVMARLNESAIERPELEELPPLPAEAEQTPGDDATGEGDSPNDEAATEGEGQPGESIEEATSATPEEIARIREERNLIEDRNNAATKQYESKLEEGRKQVEDLNLRFGDWYYVIGNDVFKKIHLTGDQVIKLVEAPGGTPPSGNFPPGIMPPAAVPIDGPPYGEAGTPIPGLPVLPETSDEEPNSESDSPDEVPSADAATDDATDSATDDAGETSDD